MIGCSSHASIGKTRTDVADGTWLLHHRAPPQATAAAATWAHAPTACWPSRPSRAPPARRLPPEIPCACCAKELERDAAVARLWEATRRAPAKRFAKGIAAAARTQQLTRFAKGLCAAAAALMLASGIGLAAVRNSLPARTPIKEWEKIALNPQWESTAPAGSENEDPIVQVLLRDEQ